MPYAPSGSNRDRRRKWRRRRRRKEGGEGATSGKFSDVRLN
jgi:hypothetical protein